MATISGYKNNEDAGVISGLSLTTTAMTASHVGNYAITPSNAMTANYAITYNSGTLTVLPATLTYVADSKNIYAGDAIPTLTGIVTGFVSRETLATATNGILTFTTSATASSMIGSYAVDGSGLTANHANYVFVQATGNAVALTTNDATQRNDVVVDAKKNSGGRKKTLQEVREKIVLTSGGKCRIIHGLLF